MLQTGIRGNCSVTVTESNSAQTVGSGTLAVFATPAMIALMEKTAWQSISPYLEEGKCTVGTKLDIQHLAPTPIGMTVTCKSVLTEIDGRRLVFDVTATDGCETIGKGRHERFIVSCEPFQEKANGKLAK